MPVVRDLAFWITVCVSVPVGLAFGAWGGRLIARDRLAMNRPPGTQGERRAQMLLLAALFVLLSGGLHIAVQMGCQQTPEVIPSATGLVLRRMYHQLLIGLILVATFVDWDGYVIPDQITLPGMLAGFGLAGLVGQVQLIHLWVDWSQAIPELRGPYFPEWFDRHRHLHGCAWSAAGLAVGGGLTWLVRGVSSRLLGRETLGFGDVTLMGMIGSFLGWQPTVCAFLAAPLLGLAAGLPLKLLTNKPYLPYGPFLGAGAILVLFSWGPLWFRTRDIFGDWLGLAMLAGLAGAAFILLLGLMLAYRSLPGKG